MLGVGFIRIKAVNPTNVICFYVHKNEGCCIFYQWYTVFITHVCFLVCACVCLCSSLDKVASWTFKNWQIGDEKERVSISFYWYDGFCLYVEVLYLRAFGSKWTKQEVQHLSLFDTNLISSVFHWPARFRLDGGGMLSVWMRRTLWGFCLVTSEPGQLLDTHQPHFSCLRLLRSFCDFYSTEIRQVLRVKYNNVFPSAAL